MLKSIQHKQTSEFLEKLLELNLIPTITRLTRITNTRVTLIDNTFISNKLQCNFDLAILLEDISDHLPSITMLKQTKICDKRSLTFESRNLNEAKIRHIKHLLFQIDWMGKLNSGDCNVYFNKFCKVVSDTMDKIAPHKLIHISAKRRFIEPWMIKGLEKASRTKKKLYKKTLTVNLTEEDVLTYRTHRNIYNKLKQDLMTTY